MFVVRGIAVSLMSLIIVYGILSLLVAVCWRAVNLLQQRSPRGRANLLFWLRISPLLASAALTLTLVIPAYVRLEPRAIDEDIALPLVLGLACVSLFVTGVIRVITAHKNSARVVVDWLNGANVLDAGVTARTYQSHQDVPPLTLVGVCAPRVVVSERTVAVLNRDELRVAVQHEIAHMRSRDNLKKLVFHCSPFPGMAGLEGAWHEAAELAADDQAVSSVGEALDLAAALIKLTRALPMRTCPAFTMGLIDGASSVRRRVQRLLAWQGKSIAPGPDWIYLLAPISVGLMVAVAFYGPALASIHVVTEWLVR